jgi:hypothetical protein
MSESNVEPGTEPVTEVDRAEEMAEAAGVDPTPEQVNAYRRAQGDSTIDAGVTDEMGQQPRVSGSAAGRTGDPGDDLH